MNPEGTPIWYELKSIDPDASKTFYDAVIGWTIEPQPAGEIDYRMIETGHGQVGGVMRLSDEMAAGGASAGWSTYVGVEDVDATAAKVTAHGGRVAMGPWDVPGVGRMAAIADPHGVPLYIMRGASDADSTAYDRMGMGKCNWNELNTVDQAAANAFYAAVFGWGYPDKMAMGEFGDYVFVEAGGQTIGATMTVRDGGPPPGWCFYFRAPDIEAAAAKVVAGGGSVLHGPVDVPGGDRIIVASDPHGSLFGVVGPGAQGSMTMTTRIAACLWYDGQAEQAARFYVDTFGDGAITAIHRAPSDYPAGVEGAVLTVEFTLLGREFVALNGGDYVRFNDAVSFQVFTDTQAETDRLWDAIVADGGSESQCSWCRDRFGLSWQIVPRQLGAALADPDPAAAKRAFAAMMTMRKIDIAAIEAARAGPPA